jgi:hypothetical protein
MTKEKFEFFLDTHSEMYKEQFGLSGELELKASTDMIHSLVRLYGDLPTLQSVLAEHKTVIDEECLRTYCKTIF